MDSEKFYNMNYYERCEFVKRETDSGKSIFDLAKEIGIEPVVISSHILTVNHISNRYKEVYGFGKKGTKKKPF